VDWPPDHVAAEFKSFLRNDGGMWDWEEGKERDGANLALPNLDGLADAE
jgi:hypothetical protein